MDVRNTISGNKSHTFRERLSWFSPIPSLDGFLGLLEHLRMTALGVITSPQDNLSHGKKVPIYVLVPGFSGNNATMSILGNHIAQRANIAYAPEFPQLNTWSIADSASILADKLEQVLSTDGLSRDIRLITYSNGGLIALDALRKRSTLKVNRVVTMGTPFFWTPLAHPLSSVLSSCREVNTKWWYFSGYDFSPQVKQGIIAHVSHKDSIVPPSSQVPDRSIAPGKVSRIDHHDFHHTNFILWKSSSRVAEIILTEKAK